MYIFLPYNLTYLMETIFRRMTLHMIGISNLLITKVKRTVSLKHKNRGKCYTLSMHVFIGTTTMLFRKCKKPFRSLPGA